MTHHVLRIISQEPVTDGDVIVNTVALPKPEVGDLWLHFTKEHNPDKAAERFRERFGYWPKHNVVILGRRCCGPIEVIR